MTSILSNHAGNANLTQLLDGTTYVALHLTDPTATGLLATEVAGGGYIRQPITYAAATGKIRVSTKALIFPGMPACIVAFLAGWDAISAGNMIWRKELSPHITVLASGQFLVAVGDIAVKV